MSNPTVKKLSNGVRVVMEPMPHASSAAVSLWLARGSRNERREQNGMTHFCEHLLFKGTARHDWRALAREISLLGGNVNAYTSPDHLRLYAHVIRRDLADTISLLVDMLLNSYFPAKEVARERDVILEEIAMYEDIPEDLCYEHFTQELLLPHPVGQPVIGTSELVSGFTRARLKSFWQRTLSPDALIVSVAGDFDPRAVMRQLSKAFSTLGPGTGTEPRGMEPSTGRAGRRLIDRDTEQVNFCFGATGPKRNHPRRFAWGLYDLILGSGFGSRLFEEVREKRGLAYSIGSSLATMHEAGYLTISGSTRPETAATAIKICQEQVELLASDGPTEQELVIAKRQLERATLIAVESNGVRATINGERELYGMKHETVDWVLAQLSAVTREEVMQVAREVTSFGAPAMVAVGPLKKSKGLEKLFSASRAA